MIFRIITARNIDESAVNFARLHDKELLDLLKQDQEPAFNELYTRYHDFLYAYAYKLTGDHNDSNEITQTIFINLWTKRAELYIQGHFVAYLHQSVRFGFLNMIKSRNVLSRYEADLQRYLDTNRNTIDEYLVEKELIRQLRAIAGALPGKYGKVFLLSYFENYTPGEIADIMQVSEGTVRNILTKAVRDVRLQAGLSIALTVLTGTGM